ncbi:uncharacterized protein LOC127100886 [Lathyrus oleraceus]|uniref:DNA-3-methyladenine glycosylase I n=1 Tax=Pisum sativum TaxID=3888 RepID=A0A9D4VXV1_PEA|nr:uncharacterized protein LOC127100886 [Pisum sativum]KAI5392353.1 hypothetical protein KIW84_076946 [Pisum sativum]
MSGPPRVRSMNVTVGDSDSRPVLVPAGNKVRPVKTVKKPAPETEKKSSEKVMNSQCELVTPVVSKRRENHLLVGMRSMSMNASCSSDASSTGSSTYSSGASSSGKMARRGRKKQVGLKVEKVSIDAVAVPVEVDSSVGLEGKKRCAWVTPNTEPCYIAFHDEEWGVPVHDDKKLFELLSFSGALAELSWPTILGKRQLFREVFLDFDPCAVSRMNEKKTVVPGSPASSLLSELRLRSIIENARQMCKVTEEFGSFDNYIWNFVNNKSIVNQFRYPRQVPAKSPKAEFVSKDLVKRGFRSVGPTVIYTFMQVAGLTNDHLISCFRFKECIFSKAEAEDKEISSLNSKVKEKANEDPTNVGLMLAVNKLSFSS